MKQMGDQACLDPTGLRLNSSCWLWVRLHWQGSDRGPEGTSGPVSTRPTAPAHGVPHTQPNTAQAADPGCVMMGENRHAVSQEAADRMPDVPLS